MVDSYLNPNPKPNHNNISKGPGDSVKLVGGSQTCEAEGGSNYFRTSTDDGGDRVQVRVRVKVRIRVRVRGRGLRPGCY